MSWYCEGWIGLAMVKIAPLDRELRQILLGVSELVEVGFSGDRHFGQRHDT